MLQIQASIKYEQINCKEKTGIEGEFTNEETQGTHKLSTLYVPCLDPDLTNRNKKMAKLGKLLH